MTSDPQAVQSMPFIQRLLERNRAAAEWDAANPELAAAWNEAIREEHERERERERQFLEQEYRERLPERMVRIGVPVRCAELVAREDAITETDAFLEARDWLVSSSPFLLLLGGVGAGKSVAGAWTVCAEVSGIVRSNPLVSAEVLERKAMFIRAAELSRVTASDYSADARRTFEALASTKLLVLDDLGAERAWDGWLSRLDELLDRRYGNRLRTVITSNLDGQMFKTRYGERIADRIRHEGRIVSAGNESLRKPEARP